MVRFRAVGWLDAQAGRLAAAQHGVVTRAELLDLGFSERQVGRRLASGDLRAAARGVYVVAGAPPTPEQAILLAVRAEGVTARASHRTAAWLWGLPGGVREPVEISVPRRRRRDVTGVVCHERFTVERPDLAVVRGIPTTTVARTLLDIGVALPFPVFEAAAEQALLAKLTSIEQLRDVRQRVGGRGRPGSAAVRAFLDERGAGVAPAESRLEVELIRLLRDHGLPRPVRQHELAVPGHGRFRLDLAYPEVRLAIEADGRRWHSGAADFQRDRVKSNALLLMGWQVLRFTWADVRERPEQVANAVRLGLTRRSAS